MVKNKKRIIAVFTIALIVFFALPLILINIPFHRESGIKDPGAFYKNQKVLLIMPHQDDELYGLASTVLNYVRAGSEVSVVYSTNGDYYSKEIGATRINEAKNVLTHMGVSEENIYFLGYGDQYRDTDIYTGGDDVIISRAGSDRTYGTEEYPDFHTLLYNQPALYTRDNFRSDVKDIILHLKPTTIYCVDFDSNIEHRVLSLLFEEAMYEILKESGEYAPRVFKVPVYLKKDTIDFFDGMNQKSITKPVAKSIYDSNYDTDIPGYAWEDRLRLPAADGILGWTRATSYLNDLFLMYKSQKDISFVFNANSDDVAWERRTDSLTYAANCYVTSGAHKERIYDFKWTDATSISIPEIKYENFLWQPSTDDGSKIVKFTFDKPQKVSSVVILEDPDSLNNILKLSIYNKSGELLASGAPDKLGRRSEFVFAQTETDEITVKIDEFQGVPGLAEVEIFEEAREKTEIIKLYLDNANETFVYNALVAKNEEETAFKLYTYPHKPINWDDYSIGVSQGASYRTAGDILYVKGEKEFNVTITDINNCELTDTITITKFSKPKAMFFRTVQMIDGIVYGLEEFYHTDFNKYVRYYYNAFTQKIKSLF